MTMVRPMEKISACPAFSTASDTQVLIAAFS